MRPLITLFVSLAFAFGLHAQTSCSALLNHTVNSANPAIIDFALSSASSPYVSGYQHRYIMDYGVGIPDTFFVHPNYSSLTLTKTYTSTGVYFAQLTMQLIDSVTNNVLCTATDIDSFLISSTTISCGADFSYLLQASGSLTVDFQDQSVTSAGNKTYQWSFGDGTSGSTASPTHTYSAPGTYLVQMKVMLNQNGVLQCTDSLVKAVKAGAMDSCHAYFNHYPSSGTINRINFQNLSQAGSVVTPNVTSSYEWYFGDGNSSSLANPVHTYSQLGNYQVTLILYSRDSQNQTMLCTDTFVNTINVNYPAPGCHAYYYLDSMNSSASNVNIYNSSTPSTSHPTYTVNYQWDFGDGITSSQPFPTHTFQSNGTYNVCVTVSVVDTNNQTCTDTYCRQIGVDSLGNIIYKNSSTGFTLNVLDPNTVGQEEHEKLNVEIYPNPASNFINVEGMKEGGEWSLYNIQGGSVAEGYLEPGESKIDFGTKKPGLYILSLKSESRTKTIKLSIK